MLNRQKLILEMLRIAGRPVTKIEVVKWAFVLAHETPTRGGASFYEFLPYHYGPYSFSMHREIGGLAEEGLIEADEKFWTLKARDHKHNLPSSIVSDIRRVVTRFQSWPQNELLDYVYRTYPAYTVNSKRQKLAERPVAAPAVYTAGYEGLQVDGFLDRLVQNGIQRLIDVRNNPVARRYGFHKSTLQRLCGHLDIEYVHIPELGIVSAERQNLDSPDDYETLFDRYESQTLPAQSACVASVGTLMLSKPSVLVCMEAEACRCHRSRLANSVAERTGLSIVHLGAE